MLKPLPFLQLTEGNKTTDDGSGRFRTASLNCGLDALAM